MSNTPALNLKLSGRHLLEAAAGTGKTYTIVTLFVRMILVKNLSVESILTVTYTEAAARELKDRIRQGLEEALNILEKRENPTDNMAHIIKEADCEELELRRRIHVALRDFDETMISTIHGFCASMLRDFAFENRRLFSMELTSSRKEIIAEFVKDYYRINFYGTTPAIMAVLNYNNLLPHDLAKTIHEIIGKPGAKILYDKSKEIDFRLLEEVSQKLVNTWTISKAEIISLVTDSPVLSRAKDSYNSENIDANALVIDSLVNEEITPRTIAALEFFAKDELDNGVTKANKRKGETGPSHSFFNLCETFTKLCTETKSQIIFDVYKYVIAKIIDQREEFGSATYDDLLLDLRNALRASSSELAIESIRNRFNAALIDEFQDTDPIQYEIFNTLFNTEDKILILVGDPKQAIYSFRGADIFTYGRAKSETKNIWSLDTNYRSESNLVEAINQLFYRKDISPFLSKIVRYDEPIKANGQKNKLLINGKIDSAPLKVFYPTAPLVKGEVSQNNLTAIASQITATNISNMLNDPGLTLQGERLRPSDFAVLLTRNTQAQIVKQDLAQYNIPAIPKKSESVLFSPEAENMQYLVSAWEHWNSTYQVRMALSLDIFRLNAEQLLDEELIIAHQNNFRRYHKLWQETGFITAFYRMAAEYELSKELMNYSDGERRLTNYQHLAELIFQYEKEHGSDADSIIAFLNDSQDEQDSEANEIRLESDRDAVSLITVHKSKGLQFPIVFCPFMNIEREFKNKGIVVRHNENTSTPELILTPKEEDYEQGRQENNSEKLRLLYVALTRAINRCIVVQGKVKNSNTLEHIFGSEPELVKKLTQSCVERISVSEITSAKMYIPQQKDKNLKQPTMPRKVRRSWNISSFTELAGHSHVVNTDDYFDYDVELLEPVANAPKNDITDIFHFPGGIKTGDCFHDIFDSLDFSVANKDSIAKKVEISLQKYNLLDEEKLAIKPVTNMVEAVISAELLPGLTLNKLKAKDTLHEMRFLYPLKRAGVVAEKLKQILANYATPEKPYALPESFDYDLAKNSFMAGAIDLVFKYDNKFYVLDWKSNRLDGIANSFLLPGLYDEMKRNSYTLQYLIYIVAWNRRMRLIDPNYNYKKDFGGVFYFFLRGANPDNFDSGIFRDIKPEPELIEELERILPEDLS